MPTTSKTTSPPEVAAGPATDPTGAVSHLSEAAARAPMHARDRVPTVILRGQAWVFRWASGESRVVLSLVIVTLTVVVAIALASSRLLHVLISGLDVVALAGLFLVNWLGNGGVLVPIPGARFIGLLLVFQQAVILPSWEVFAVAGAGMALGLLSYYLAGARTAQSYAEGDDVGATTLAQESGMLDDDASEFSPGAGLEEQAVSAIAGVPHVDEQEPSGSSEDDASRLQRVRRRFSTTLRRAQERAEPVIEQRGFSGMFILCFAPTPLSTAGAYVGGLVRFGFTRYLLASFAAKYLLAGVIVVLALTFSSTAESVRVPELNIPVINVTLFDDGVPGPGSTPGPGASPGPAGSPGPTSSAD